MRFLCPVVLLACLALEPGCFAPQTPSQRVVEAARDANLAARFGRMDLAIERTTPGMRKTFMARRKSWGREIRIVDVQLAGMTMPDHDNATVLVDFSWTRIDEGTLHATRVAQKWKNEEGTGWALVREKRAAGDRGLFGEAVAVRRTEPRGDTHFPSKTIR